MLSNFDILELIKGNCRFYLGDHVDITFVVHQPDQATQWKTITVLKTEDGKREHLFSASGHDLEQLFSSLLRDSATAAKRHIVCHGYQSLSTRDNAKVKEGERSKKRSRKNRKGNYVVLSGSSDSDWTTSDDSDSDSSDASTASSRTAASRRHGRGRVARRPSGKLPKPFFAQPSSMTGVPPPPSWLPGNAATVPVPLPPHARCAGPPPPPNAMLPFQNRAAMFMFKSEKYGEFASLERCIMNIDIVLRQARAVLQERFMDFSDAPDVSLSKKQIKQLDLTVESVKLGGKKYGIGKGVSLLSAALPLGPPSQPVTFVIKVEKKDELKH